MKVNTAIVEAARRDQPIRERLRSAGESGWVGGCRERNNQRAEGMRHHMARRKRGEVRAGGQEKGVLGEKEKG